MAIVENNPLQGQQSRIMNALRKVAQPDTQEISGRNNLEAMVSQLGGKGDYFGTLRNLQSNDMQNTVNAETSVYNMMKEQIAQGDQEAAGVHKAITSVVGDDPKLYAQILNDLHNDPENVSSRNAPAKVMKYAAERGIVPLSLQEQKAKINQMNASAERTRRSSSMVVDPVTGEITYTEAKPMPAAALKLQNEALDIIGTASNIDSDLGSIVKQIEDKKIDLGPINNAINSMLNYSGKSTEKSRNYATFKSTLERMRNDSLRLNKGVQTEGDAVRAWNEIFENINDNELVSKRLKEIKGLNTRAADLQELIVDNIRANYGQPGLDYSKYKKGSVIGNEPQNNEPVDYKEFFK